MCAVKNLLAPFVLYQLDDAGLWKNGNTLLFQLFQRIGIDMFYFNGKQIHAAAKTQYSLKIVEVSADKFI